jgi:EAL domain-containing protein (putative c-di-GMP-specific phosphodiesterase class I)
LLMRHLGLRVVGEGVERPEQLKVLRAVGCHAVQGYLFGRPQEASEIDASSPLAPAGSLL